MGGISVLRRQVLLLCLSQHRGRLGRQLGAVAQIHQSDESVLRSPHDAVDAARAVQAEEVRRQRRKAPDRLRGHPYPGRGADQSGLERAGLRAAVQ